MEKTHRRKEEESFFFPILLICVGVIWLLINQGIIPEENIYRLAPFWPLLLVLGGLSLLFGRLWWPLKALVWLAGGALAVWVVWLPSASYPQVQGAGLNRQSLTEPLGSVTAASIRVELGIYPANIFAAKNRENLLTADVYSLDEVLLTRSGNQDQNLHLFERDDFDGMSWFQHITDLAAVGQKPWQIGLAPDLPLDLTVSSGTGKSTLNLTGLTLSRLSVDAGTGSIKVQLPVQKASLPVKIHTGTGSGQIILPADTSVDLSAESGTGSLNIQIPSAKSGVQVEVIDAGIGRITLPDGFTKVSGDREDRTGVWENEAFQNAKNPIHIRLDLGTGGATIRLAD